MKLLRLTAPLFLIIGACSGAELEGFATLRAPIADCESESDFSFCGRWATECGETSNFDNCEVLRTVDCGDLRLNFDASANGESLPGGTIVDEQWAELGVHLRCENGHRAGRSVSHHCESPGSLHPDLCLAFDSVTPTGGDFDLGTPHEDFGGAGVGPGGAQGQPGSNETSLFNLLIIAENATDDDNNGLVDDPDDEGDGGQMTFEFDMPVTIASVSVVDIDSGENGGTIVTCIDESGDKITTSIPELGGNSVQEIAVGAAAVVEMQVDLVSSGAVSEIRLCVVAMDEGEGEGASPQDQSNEELEVL